MTRLALWTLAAAHWALHAALDALGERIDAAGPCAWAEWTGEES